MSFSENCFFVINEDKELTNDQQYRPQSPTNTDSGDDCQKECMVNTTCEAYTFDKQGSQCIHYFKALVNQTQFQSREGFVTGYKHCKDIGSGMVHPL